MSIVSITIDTQWLFKKRLHYEVFEIKHMALNRQVKLTDFTLFWGTSLIQICNHTRILFSQVHYYILKVLTEVKIYKKLTEYATYRNNDKCYFVIYYRTNLLNCWDNDSSERDYFCDKSARNLQPEVTMNTTLSIVSNMRQEGHLSVCSFVVNCKCLNSSYILWHFKSKGH